MGIAAGVTEGWVELWSLHLFANGSRRNGKNANRLESHDDTNCRQLMRCSFAKSCHIACSTCFRSDWNIRKLDMIVGWRCLTIGEFLTKVSSL